MEFSYVWTNGIVSRQYKRSYVYCGCVGMRLGRCAYGFLLLNSHQQPHPLTKMKSKAPEWKNCFLNSDKSKWFFHHMMSYAGYEKLKLEDVDKVLFITATPTVTTTPTHTRLSKGIRGYAWFFREGVWSRIDIKRNFLTGETSEWFLKIRLKVSWSDLPETHQFLETWKLTRYYQIFNMDPTTFLNIFTGFAKSFWRCFHFWEND